MQKSFLFTIALTIGIWHFLSAQPGKRAYSSSSDKAIKYFEKAQLSFDARKDEEAIDLLLKSIKADEQFIEAHMFLGEVYAEQKKYELALNEVQKAVGISPDFFKSAYYSMGFWCLKLQRYDEAEKNFNHFIQYKGLSKEAISNAKLGLNSAIFAKNAVAHPVPFNPQNMGAQVNSAFNDYLPAMSADEQTLIYTRLIPKLGNEQDKDMRHMSEDFYECSKENGIWSKAQNIGPPINTEGNEGAQCISADGKTLVFTACKEYDGYPGGRKGFGSCDLFVSYRNINGKWSTPENMGKPVNSEYWDSQPSLSADGQTIYFVSNRPGGKGAADIWRSTKNKAGNWTTPVNLGDSINTPENEESPFVHPDNRTLYFCSEGWPGMGNKDLFIARKNSDGIFTHPTNLGYPINTAENERDLIVGVNGKTAYFSSERPGGTGGLDLYSFELYEAARPIAVTYVKGKVTDAETNTGLDASLELIDLNTGEIVMQAQSKAKSGDYLLCLPANKNYAMNVNKNGYLFASENFSLKGINHLEPYNLQVKLHQVKVGEKVVLKNIFFETGSYQLQQESEIELNKLADFMQNNMAVHIEIGGHTDNVGDKKSNILLSENRAKAVLNYISGKGVANERLSFKGYGDTMPVADNNTTQGRALNRRTEFTIVK